MRTASARTKTFLAAGLLAVLVLIGGAALLVGWSTANVTRTDSDVRAARGLGLLVMVGPYIPDLTQAAITHGLPSAGATQLDHALARAQHAGLLANFVVWDRTGLIVYSGVASTEGTRPPMTRELATVLSGRSLTQADPNEPDPSTGRRTGLLDALQPLVDAHGRVYGAVEASLSLKPIGAAAGQSRDRSMLVVIGGGVLLAVLLLPLEIRLAGSLANDWIPGRRRVLRLVRSALDDDDIVLVYQPQIEPGSGRVDGVEALVRCRRDGELIGPDRFLPAVESSALMPRLTDRVLDLALAQLAEWRGADILVRVSVNLSATDLADKALPERIAAKLDLHGVAGQDLVLEVTETAILEDPERAELVLRAITAQDIAIALDDFGTGHASTSRLHELPVFSEVKIDRSFVSNTEPRSRAYLRAMIGFIATVGLRIVAEGVEDVDTLDLLATLGCDLAQGYLIARPLPPAAMTLWLTTSHSALAAKPPRPPLRAASYPRTADPPALSGHAARTGP